LQAGLDVETSACATLGNNFGLDEPALPTGQAGQVDFSCWLMERRVSAPPLGLTVAANSSNDT